MNSTWKIVLSGIVVCLGITLLIAIVALGSSGDSFKQKFCSMVTVVSIVDSDFTLEEAQAIASSQGATITGGGKGSYEATKDGTRLRYQSASAAGTRLVEECE